MIHILAVAAYVQSHVLSVLLSIVVSIAVGFIWHGMLFNKQWAKLSKLDHLSKKEKSAAMLPGILAVAVMALVQAAVIGRALELLTLENITHAFIIATVLWIPFTALVLLNNYIWARKPMALFLIDAGYSLATLWSVAAVSYTML